MSGSESFYNDWGGCEYCRDPYRTDYYLAMKNRIKINNTGDVDAILVFLVSDLFYHAVNKDGTSQPRRISPGLYETDEVVELSCSYHIIDLKSQKRIWAGGVSARGPEVDKPLGIKPDNYYRARVSPFTPGTFSWRYLESNEEFYARIISTIFKNLPESGEMRRSIK